MRCIEMFMVLLCVTVKLWINRNMRCIEIFSRIHGVQPTVKINRNMRCIEIADDVVQYVKDF